MMVANEVLGVSTITTTPVGEKGRTLTEKVNGGVKSQRFGVQKRQINSSMARPWGRGTRAVPQSLCVFTIISRLVEGFFAVVARGLSGGREG
jgi:hypothetical protein